MAAKKQSLPPIQFNSIFIIVFFMILGMASVFIYDRTIWIAQAQNNSSNPGSSTAIKTCVNNTNGNLRVVENSSACKTSEKELNIQSAINGLISDVEVIWQQAEGDRNTNYDAGVNIKCPDNKKVISGGSTGVTISNLPTGDDISGISGRSTNHTGWSITPYRINDAPYIYAVCAKVNN